MHAFRDEERALRAMIDGHAAAERRYTLQLRSLGTSLPPQIRSMLRRGIGPAPDDSPPMLLQGRLLALRDRVAWLEALVAALPHGGPLEQLPIPQHFRKEFYPDVARVFALIERPVDVAEQREPTEEEEQQLEQLWNAGEHLVDRVWDQPLGNFSLLFCQKGPHPLVLATNGREALIATSMPDSAGQFSLQPETPLRRLQERLRWGSDVHLGNAAFDECFEVQGELAYIVHALTAETQQYLLAMRKTADLRMEVNERIGVLWWRGDFRSLLPRALNIVMDVRHRSATRSEKAGGLNR